MAIPRFLEFAEAYRSPYQSVSGGLLSGLQTGEKAMQQRQATKLTKARAELAEVKAMQPLAGIPLTGPAGEYNSFRTLLNTLPEGSPERAILQKAWDTDQNLKNARNVYYSTNAGYKGLTNEQKLMLQRQLQKQTGLPLSKINEMLSYAGGVYAQQGGVPGNEFQPTPIQKYNQILNKGDQVLTHEAQQYGMTLEQYKNYIRKHLGV